jgi:hypothetical protein
VSWDPLMSDDLPRRWVPFAVDVQPDGDRLELHASGQLDRWTAGALLRNLIAVCEPSYREVHLDLREVDGVEHADEVLERCRAYAEAQGVQIYVSAEGVPWRRQHEPRIGLRAPLG